MHPAPSRSKHLVFIYLFIAVSSTPLIPSAPTEQSLPNRSAISHLSPSEALTFVNNTSHLPLRRVGAPSSAPQLPFTIVLLSPTPTSSPALHHPNRVQQRSSSSLLDQPKFSIIHNAGQPPHQHDQQKLQKQDQPQQHPSHRKHLKTWSNIISNVSHPKHSKEPSKPFSVSIGKVKYYGGLVTYSHNLHPARICRIFNACVRADGSLVLPPWMQRHDNIITFHCGFSKVQFTLSDTDAPPPLQSFDLIGLSPSRPSMPDFILDFIPNAVVFDLIYGDHQVSKSCHSRKGDDCTAFPGLIERLRSAVILHHRLRRFDEKKSWVRELVKLMKPPLIGRQPQIFYDDQFINANTSHLKCFRSAFFTRGPFNKDLITSQHMRDIHFLDLHSINKKPRHFLSSKDLPDMPGRQFCHLNVTISNRKLVDGANNRLIGRYIINMVDLKQAVLKQATRIPGLKVTVATLTLEGRSLRWQINAMQKTDIWVAGHGPLLTNMVFLRENSTVMELQPFSYYPQTFERMAVHLAYVRYDRYIAHPDIEAFETCLMQLYPVGHLRHHRAKKVLSRFKQAAQKYVQSDSTHSFVLHRLLGGNLNLRHVRTCAQMQRLDTNAEKFAIAIVRQARLMCGYPQPGSHLS